VRQTFRLPYFSRADWKSASLFCAQAHRLGTARVRTRRGRQARVNGRAGGAVGAYLRWPASAFQPIRIRLPPAGTAPASPGSRSLRAGITFRSPGNLHPAGGTPFRPPGKPFLPGVSHFPSPGNQFLRAGTQNRPPGKRFLPGGTRFRAPGIQELAKGGTPESLSSQLSSRSPAIYREGRFQKCPISALPL